jgi:hypothetical protein
MPRTGLLLLLILALASAAGCALPDYLLPHGFSSSYYRHLQHAHYGAPAADAVLPPQTQPSAP